MGFEQQVPLPAKLSHRPRVFIVSGSFKSSYPGLLSVLSFMERGHSFIRTANKVKEGFSCCKY